MGLLKFLASVLLLPVVFAVTKSFYGEIGEVKTVENLFMYGVLTYVITHLFFVNFQGMYQGGQKIFSDGLKFSPFLAAFLPLILPLFPLVFMLTLFICGKFFSMELWEPYIVFFTGLTFAMHLVLTAQILRAEDTGIFKSHYFFVMSLGYIFNILIIAALFDLNFASFSFVKFLEGSADIVKNIYLYMYERLV